ncbi:glycoside hydrolase, family 25 [Lactococcus lactis]|uniref:Glycoside hydrolase, family 25 n=1 Tax=Lactococcus lactis TaxID=1358 RepID=A0AAP3Z2S9_9LACT|nr:glycoside hydrolase, family 25 [Lactococcus lactis]MDG4977332.1 glycoside hydrolase, family 25 [Lactococcus lactis]
MKIKTLVMAMVSVLTVGTFASMNQVKASADTTMPVYRLYNHYTGEHFYTKNKAEQQQLLTHGWNYEGIGWYSATSGAPVYRVYNPNSVGGDHYYTMSKYEAQSLVSKGWRWDDKGQPVFYSAGNSNLYVAYNPNAQSGSHNYTSNTFEQNTLLSKGWIYGKVAWKTMGTNPTTPPKPPVQKYKYLSWISVDGVRKFTKLCDTMSEADSWGDKMMNSDEVIELGYDHSIRYGVEPVEVN